MVAFPIRPGSIVVNHTVIFSLMVTTQTEEKFENITTDLEQKIHVAVAQNCTDGT